MRRGGGGAGLIAAYNEYVIGLARTRFVYRVHSIYPWLRCATADVPCGRDFLYRRTNTYIIFVKFIVIIIVIFISFGHP